MRKYRKTGRQEPILGVTEKKKNLSTSKVKTIVRNTVEFQCSICKTRYSKRKDAQKCGKRIREKVIFKKGDKVKNISFLCECNSIKLKNKKPFFAIGVIVKRFGSEPMDYEYSVKWLGGRLRDYHVYRYLMEFKCLCGNDREVLLYSVELEKIAD